jgi:hypothetical protein
MKFSITILILLVLRAVLLNVIILNVVMLNAVMLSVVAPLKFSTQVGFRLALKY